MFWSAGRIASLIKELMKEFRINHLLAVLFPNLNHSTRAMCSKQDNLRSSKPDICYKKTAKPPSSHIWKSSF